MGPLQPLVGRLDIPPAVLAELLTPERLDPQLRQYAQWSPRQLVSTADDSLGQIVTRVYTQPFTPDFQPDIRNWFLARRLAALAETLISVALQRMAVQNFAPANRELRQALQEIARLRALIDRVFSAGVPIALVNRRNVALLSGTARSRLARVLEILPVTILDALPR